MRRLLGSLFFRLALLVVLVVLASQAFTLWMSARQREHLLADQLYAQVIDTLADLEGALDNLTPLQRVDFLIAYNRPGFPRLLPAASRQDQRFLNSLPSLGQSLQERLSLGMNEPVTVLWAQQTERQEIWLDVQVIGQRYWLVMPVGRYIPPSVSPVLLGGLLFSLLAILAASVLAWRVTRPLTDLAHAARQLESGYKPEPVPPSGPSEVRVLAKRFNRMAEALDDAARERRLMLAGLSHDLRTPLTRLKLTVELQQNSQDKDDMLADIDELSRIVRQFVDFARSEETSRREPVALAELAASVVARFRREGMEVGLRRGAEPEIEADALALERLLTNLIENARRYGRPPVRVGVDANATTVTLTVSDRGSGIAPAQRENALAPFERLAEHRGTDGGSGLGLAIVARIVKQHGGALFLEDAPEGGFRVRITLPQAATPATLLPAP
ncbi:integral membrane sensor signal transduction histidine kinase [Pseudogulbenkiania sp. NH8B]|uniref:ATP-binding protein n=1 Tax=Pseudogulbenkiania sp. (strain NH8B) TaxID=748280 RepID=UPI000227976F|nr:ATP-binding protein [Pseudogulbenkiania sp. NH8B]BAK74894.1 integral membrane sensor signal transduction histidine kinase [Pseudogulbenkiania sp. NH8B]